MNLPSNIIINILSTLPVPTITRCKCVCKSWLHLLSSPEFANLHLSKSGPGLAVFQQRRLSSSYEIYDFTDDPDRLENHDLHYNLVTNFQLPHQGLLIQGSADGLLFLRDLSHSPNALFICNPITREYLEIHCPDEFTYSYPQVVTFGFGSSGVGEHYKVVRIFHDCSYDQETNKRIVTKSECHVYTLGATGSWRSVAPAGDPFFYSCRSIGAYLNGKLHWWVSDSNGFPLISCFDLETELFSSVSVPPERTHGLADVFAVEGCLCACDNGSEDEIVVWLMKEYGDEKSWRKEFVIQKPDVEVSSYDPYQVVRPIKVLKDGDILMEWGDFFLFYSPSKTRTIVEIDRFGARSFGAIDSILHTSSFLSLKTFGIEEVHSFCFFFFFLKIFQ